MIRLVTPDEYIIKIKIEKMLIQVPFCSGHVYKALFLEGQDRAGLT